MLPLNDVVHLAVTGIAQGCAYGLIALGFVLIYKATEVVNFAHGEFMMLSAFAVLAFSEALAGMIFGWNARSLDQAGPDLTLQKVLAALETINKYEYPFGGPTLTLSPQKHQAGDFLNLHQVQDGKWVIAERNLSF